MKCSSTLQGTLGIAMLIMMIPAQLVAVEYSQKISLDKMSFEWRLNNKMIHIRLKAETKGWVAVGFNSTNSMKGANFVIGYVKRGKVRIQDSYGIRMNEHIRDIMNNGKDDIMDVSGKEEGTSTTLQFTIPLVSGDKNDKKIVPGLFTKILLAFGPDRDSFDTEHLFRTVLTVNLTTGEYQ